MKKYYVEEKIISKKDGTILKVNRLTGDTEDKAWAKTRLDVAWNELLKRVGSKAIRSFSFTGESATVERIRTKHIFEIKTKEEPTVLTASQAILGLVEKYNANYDAVLEAISKHEMDGLEKYVAKNTKPYLTMLDSDYPDFMKVRYKPVILMYYEGLIALLKINFKRLGIVTRKNISEDLAKEARKTIHDLPTNIVIVTSNKTVAQWALESPNPHRVILVLACGLNRTTAECDEKTKKAVIAKGGLIITVKPQDSIASGEDFIRKNHLIAAVSDALLGLDIKPCSGSLVALSFALNNGSDVMIFPTLPNTPDCMNNNLIVDGAFLVENAKDIQEILFNE